MALLHHFSDCNAAEPDSAVPWRRHGSPWPSAGPYTPAPYCVAEWICLQLLRAQ